MIGRFKIIVEIRRILLSLNRVWHIVIADVSVVFALISLI